MNEFYTGEEVMPRYTELAEAYATAFAGPPWNERSKCADSGPSPSCVGGLSALAVGEWCATCQQCPSQPAYTVAGLTKYFENLRTSRPTSWYLEDVEAGLALAALAWPAQAETIAQKKYADVPAMEPWLTDRFGDQTIVWLDEVFANRANRPCGNLANFGTMCRQFGRLIGATTLAYRTITPQMVGAAGRDFGVNPAMDVPDRRQFITINLGES